MSALQRAWHRRIRHGAADERGSALLIALVMIFVVSLVATAVLSYTGTSLTATKSVADDRKSLYAADGAIDTAIQQLADDQQRGLRPGSDDRGAGDAPTVSVLERHRARRVERGRPRRLHPGEPRFGHRRRRDQLERTRQRGAHPRPARQPAAAGADHRRRAGSSGGRAPTAPTTSSNRALYFQPSAERRRPVRRCSSSCGYTGYKQSRQGPRRRRRHLELDRRRQGRLAARRSTGHDQGAPGVRLHRRRQPRLDPGHRHRPGDRCVRRAELRRAPTPAFADPNYPSRAQLPATTDSWGNQVSGLPDKPVYANNPSSPNLPAVRDEHARDLQAGLVRQRRDAQQPLPHLRERRRQRQGLLVHARRLLLRLPQHDGDPGLRQRRHRRRPRRLRLRRREPHRAHPPVVHPGPERERRQPTTTAAQKRPHIVGGTPFGTEADRQRGPRSAQAGARLLLEPAARPDHRAAQGGDRDRADGDFTNPNNAKDIDGVDAADVVDRARRPPRRTAPPRAARSSPPAPTTSPPRPTRPARSTAPSPPHTLGSVIGCDHRRRGRAAPRSRRGTDDFANPANGRIIGGSATLGDRREPEPDGHERLGREHARSLRPAPTTSPTRPTRPARSTAPSPATPSRRSRPRSPPPSAASSQVSGSNDFANPGNGRTIGDAATTSATIANQIDDLAPGATRRAARSSRPAPTTSPTRPTRPARSTAPFAIAHARLGLRRDHRGAAAEHAGRDTRAPTTSRTPATAGSSATAATTSETIASRDPEHRSGERVELAGGVARYRRLRQRVATRPAPSTGPSRRTPSPRSSRRSLRRRRSSTQVSGSERLREPGERTDHRRLGDVVGDASRAQSTTQTYSSVVTSQVSGGPDFTPIGNATTIDGSDALRHARDRRRRR